MCNREFSFGLLSYFAPRVGGLPHLLGGGGGQQRHSGMLACMSNKFLVHLQKPPSDCFGYYYDEVYKEIPSHRDCVSYICTRVAV